MRQKVMGYERPMYFKMASPMSLNMSRVAAIDTGIGSEDSGGGRGNPALDILGLEAQEEAKSSQVDCFYSCRSKDIDIKYISPNSLFTSFFGISWKKNLPLFYVILKLLYFYV